MSILHSPSLIFNTRTTIKPYYLTSFLPYSSISNFRIRKFTIHSSFSLFNDPQDFFVPKFPGNKPKQDDSSSDDKQISFVDEWGERSEPDTRPVTKLSESDPPINDDEWGRGAELVGSSNNPVIEDEWGEKSYPEPRPVLTVSDSDPPIDEDEWIGAKPVQNETVYDNKKTPDTEPRPVTRLPDSDPPKGEEERVAELKRCLMDTVYGTNFGLRASSQIRAEALELVSQLEAANPTPSPVESPELLDGNWILVFTAFSELLPLLAVGTIPFLKVEKISQTISTSNLSIENSTTLSSPFATSSFSANAAFEVRSPSRIQVEFKEGTVNPPEVKSKIDLPENVGIFGQTISLSPIQQSLGPVENVVAGIARAISGLPPLKVTIPGERTKSWLITTYLDKDLRISRGDGGLFVLVKEESSLIDQ